MTPPTLIIGAGLSGLAAARRLHQAAHPYQLIEARERLGGRVLSHGPTGQRVDLGPAWIWPQMQSRLVQLLKALHLQTFPQYEQGRFCLDTPNGIQQLDFPQRYVGTQRILGGTAALVEALAQELNPATLQHSSPVRGVNRAERYITLSDGSRRDYHRLILALPPRLTAAVDWQPPLDDALHNLLKSLPTWMAAHAKCVVYYPTPFWRQQGLSGAAASRLGPLIEIADQSPADGSFGALFGFIGWPAEQRQQHRERLQQDCLAQLRRLFGPDAANPIDVQLMDWSQETFTAGPGDTTFPAGHPRYGHPELMGRAAAADIVLAGAETIEESGGLIEGAILAGERAAEVVLGQG